MRSGDEDFYFIHHYLQRGFTVEYLMGLDFLTRRVMIQSMLLALKEQSQKLG